MTEAVLNIRPKVVGSRGAMRTVERDLSRLDRQQRATLGRGVRAAQSFEKAFNNVGRALVRTQFGIKEIESGIQVIERFGRMAISGGRTLFGALIAPNAEMQSALTTFNVLIGDTAKAQQLLVDIRKEAAATPFAENELIDASKRLLRFTGDNITQNKQLLRVAEEMAAINPSKTVVDASEALLDAQQGEFERLKEFGVKLRKEEAKAAAKDARKNGAAFGNDYLDAVVGALTKQTGGRDIVGALSKTFRGRVSTLRDIGRNLGREIGGPAFEVLSEGIGEFNDELGRMRNSPEFKQDIKDMQGIAKDLARWGIEMTRKLPEGIRKLRELVEDLKEFWAAHGDKLKVLAGGLVADRLTNGGVSRGIGRLGGATIRGGSRLLFGRRGAGVANALGSAAGEGTPVFVTNWPAGGLGGGGGLGSAAKGIGATGGGALTTAELAAVGKGGGLLGMIGAGGLGAGLTIAGAYTFGAMTAIDAWQKTSNARKGVDRMIIADRKRAGMFTDAELVDRDARGRAAAAETRLTQNIRGAAERGDWAAVAAIAKGVAAKHGQKGIDAINNQIAFTGTKFKMGRRGELGIAGGVEGLQQGTRDELRQLQEFGARIDPNGPGGAQRLADAKASGEFERQNARANAIADLVEKSERNAKALEAALKQKRQVNVNVTVNGGDPQAVTDAVVEGINEAERQSELTQ